MQKKELLRYYKMKRAHFSRLVSKLEIIECVKKENEISITDHAILRYLERVSGVDIDHVKKLILDIVGKKSKLNDFKVVNNGDTFVVSGHRVITILEKCGLKYLDYKTKKISKREKNKINLQNSGGFR